jgi:hypothetical protein
MFFVIKDECLSNLGSLSLIYVITSNDPQHLTLGKIALEYHCVLILSPTQRETELP